MSTSKRMIVAFVMAGFVWLTVPVLSRASEEKASEDTKAIGIDAYIYGYPLSSRNEFTYNDDGSWDLCIQGVSPGKDKESNWLPSPVGQLILMLRLYWPKESMLDGFWKIPPVKPIE